MGQLAFAAVGAVVSTYVGAGPAIGWAIGSAIGGVVFAPDGAQTTGPRLDDLKSNVSTYGQPIPRVYGEIGFMGSLIWMNDIQEQENVEEQGKGGDPATATTFSYSCSFAMLLCRGEVATIPNSVAVKTINRIWINEKLYYDIRDDTDIAAVVGSANFAQYFKFYPGNQTQEPDPTMEAILGVGNVPAYLGRSYVVFTDLPLGMFQNQPPGALRIVFEVVMEGTPGGGPRFLLNTDPSPSGGATYGQMMPVLEGVVRVLAPGSYSAPTTSLITSIEGEFLGFDTPTDEELEWPWGGVAADGTIPLMRLFDGRRARVYPAGLQVSNPLNLLYAQLDESDPEDVQIDAIELLPDPTQFITSIVPCADQRHVFVFTCPGLNSVDLTDTWHLIQWQNADDGWALVRSGTVDTANHNMAPATGSSGQGDTYAAMAESDLRHIWWAGDGIGFNLHYIDDADEMAETVPSVIFNPGMFLSAVAIQMWVDNGLGYAFVGPDYVVFTRNDSGADNTQTLQEVFEAETALAGLSPAQVDGSFGSLIIVDGLFVRRLAPTRGVLSMLEPAYFWDTVESSGVLKGVLRGGASVVTITEDDLGASIGGNAEEDLINPERADEDTLPGECIVTYIDRASDYQVAAQHDRRSAVATEQPVNLEMPLVFTPSDARQIASVWMYNQWAGRTKRTIKLSRKYSYLEPTDVITLRTDVADFTCRIVAIKTNDGFIECDCVDEDAALYVQNAEGANIDQGTEITLPTPSKLVLLDIPMLRESDNDPGYYVAVAGFSDSWPGALIMRSTDGVTFNTVSSITTPAVIGNVSIALGNFTGPMGYDSVNSVTVTLFSSATLQSCTDAELLGGANAFALGSSAAGYEICQFKTAALVSGNTWKLTQLLRGRRGTEHEMAGHGTFETFVLLQESKLRRLGVSDPAIGTPVYFKAVTFGQLVGNASTQTFTNTAAGLKPYSPVNGRGTGFGGDIVITWTRRGRIYNDWRDGVELALGEATEAYVVEIWNAGNTAVVRTVSGLTSPTTTYSSANQVTDFGSNPMTLNVRIFQISAIVGRGFPLITTLS